MTLEISLVPLWSLRRKYELMKEQNSTLSFLLRIGR